MYVGIVSQHRVNMSYCHVSFLIRKGYSFACLGQGAVQEKRLFLCSLFIREERRHSHHVSRTWGGGEMVAAPQKMARFSFLLYYLYQAMASALR